MKSVAVVDHGAGNLVSMMRAIQAVGANPTLVDSGGLVGFDRVVLPGVGATGPAMRNLKRSGLADELRSYEGDLLGVCVGMQLLFDSSTEDDTLCLGLIPGEVGRIDATPLPHVGWNSVDHTDDPVFSGLSAEPLFYFVHTFAVRPRYERSVVGWTSYGEDEFASAVRVGSVTGVQFHPERSGPTGLQVLANFIEDSAEIHRVA
jgi:glutamine amidotransferase